MNDPGDTEPSDTEPSDTEPSDTGPNNAGPNNAGPNNAGPNNAGPKDAGLDDDEAAAARAKLDGLRAQLSSVVLGQNDAIDAVLVGLLADGHVLLEGVPGVAKTLLARALSASLGLTFKRVQFTPDLMPSDLLGTRIWDAERREWELSRGPIFTDVLLADEINRTPPKTQAALLEAMEERQVTLDGERHDLGEAFFVVATENPLEFEGTYPLPEAQTDRFGLKITMGYPDAEAELLLLAGGAQRMKDRVADLRPVMSRGELLELRAARARVRVDDSVRAYVLALLRATRQAGALKLGGSPRAGLFMLAVGQAAALTQGRSYVIPDDVKATAPGVLRHRLALSTEAELDGLDVDTVLDGLLSRVALRDE